MQGDVDQVDVADVAMTSGVVPSPSLSGSSRSSSDSNVNAEFCEGIEPRPTVLPDAIQSNDLRPESRIMTSGSMGDIDFRPQRASSPLLQPAALEPKEKQQRMDVQVQPTNRFDVVVLQANWHMNQNFKAMLLLIAILCSLALILYLGSSLWIRVHHYYVLPFNTKTSPADHAWLPFLPDCAEKACQVYVDALESTLNRSQDPCKDFYRFVCDGWTGQHRYISVMHAAEELMYSRALNAIHWLHIDGSGKQFTTSVASSVEQKVAGFARSCIYFSESSLDDLKKFMAERHLPWPNASRWDLLEILLDLSGNWNLHLWFQLEFEMTPFRGGTGEPVLRIAQSNAFVNWIGFMRSFVGQPVTSKSALRYRRYVKNMLKFFDVPESSADELVTKIEEMNRLTLEALGPAMSEVDPKAVRLPVRNITDSVTPSIASGRLLLLFNEYFIWARRFSAADVVEVVNPDLLRSVVYLLGLKSETRQALTLSLGLRVVHELGWMAHRGIADVTLDIMGLPTSAHYRRCLSVIESAVGVGWLSLFPEHPGAESLVQEVQGIMDDSVQRCGKPPLRLQVIKTPVERDSESLLASALPEPTAGGHFLIDWMNLMNARWRLQEQDLSNVLKPGSVLSNRWNFHSALRVAEEYFVFPFYHPDLPPAIRYGGAGRLIADEVLRGLFMDPACTHHGGHHSIQAGRNEYSHHLNDSSGASQDLHQPSVDTKALMAALGAYRLSTLRTSRNSTLPSPAQERLFFVASCYAMCSSKNFVDPLYGDASSRCNLPASRLPEFAAAFDCSIRPAHFEAV